MPADPRTPGPPWSSGEPLVSVVTPCLNHAGFIEQTIQSVLAQTYPNVEYLVIDGGSTDGSVPIIRRYEDRLAHWVSEPDRGQADAINKGLGRANGQIVAWLNSDDLYYPDTIANAVRLFAQQPQAVLVYGDAVLVDAAGQFVRYFTEVEPFNAFRLRNCADFIMQPAAFIRRQALQRVGLLDPDLHWCLDWDLWCRLAELGRVHYEPVLAAANRHHGQTKTQIGGRQRLEEVRQVWRRHGSSLWPHALFSYRAKELRLRRAATRSRWRRPVLSVAALACEVGGIANFFHARRHRRAIRGLTHGSHACGQSVSICFPLFRPARSVELSLRSAQPWKLQVRLNGHLEPPQTLAAPAGHVAFDLPPSVINDHLLDLQISRQGTSVRQAPLYLEALQLR